MPTLAQIWTEEGRQEGMQQGMILGEQEMLIDALEAKFEHVPAQVIEEIQAVSDRDKLRFLLKMVFSIQSIHEFERIINSSG